MNFRGSDFRSRAASLLTYVGDFPPTEENMPRLKAWLIGRFSTSSFNTSSAPLATMSGPPIKIHINPEVNSEVFHKPNSIPHHWPRQ